MLILTAKGIYAARDKFGRTPVIIGKKEGAFLALPSNPSPISILGTRTTEN